MRNFLSRCVVLISSDVEKTVCSTRVMSGRVLDGYKSIISQLGFARCELSKHSSTPMLDAELLMCHVLGYSREDLFLHYSDVLTDDKIMSFHEFIERRRKYSVAHIVGKKEFWKSEFIVTVDTFVPRPDTEAMIEAVLSHYKLHSRSIRILEVGTGSGCIIISLLLEYRNGVGIAFEKSNKAFRVALANSKRHKVSSRLRIFNCDFKLAERCIKGKFDIIVSNPPYIRTPEIQSLQTEIQNEPCLALDGGFRGVEPYYGICHLAEKFLSPMGKIFLEVGDYWKKNILGNSDSFTEIDSFNDLTETRRVIVLSKKNQVV